MGDLRDEAENYICEIELQELSSASHAIKAMAFLFLPNIRVIIGRGMVFNFLYQVKCSEVPSLTASIDMPLCV